MAVLATKVRKGIEHDFVRVTTLIENKAKDSGVDLGGPKGPRPSLLLNKMFDRECKNVQNSNKIASNSLKMLEIVFRTIQNSIFFGGAYPG